MLLSANALDDQHDIGVEQGGYTQATSSRLELIFNATIHVVARVLRETL